MVVLINLPFITRHYMPAHDAKEALGFFDYFYSNYLFSGSLPQWMVYGGWGLDAAPFHIFFVSAPSYLAMFVGKALGMNDSLTLFSIAICLEQLLFLLGFYLLSRRLLREPLAIFCVCLTAVGLVEWQFQPYWNLRVFCLLPLAFYFILRLRYDAAGYCGWLAGVVAILGPAGSVYTYMLWSLVLPVFATVAFWGRFGRLKAMLRPNLTNVISAALFAVLALAFLGALRHSLDNFKFNSPGRDASGGVSLSLFLTYGSTNLSEILSSLLLPRAFMGDASSGRWGMTDYVGLISLCCLPRALRSLRNSPQAYPFAVACLVVAGLSLGGVAATAIYFFPGMHIFRHVAFVTGVLRVLLLILAGFGCDALIAAIRERTLIPRPTRAHLFVIILGLLFYVDLNIGGSVWASACEGVARGIPGLLDSLRGTSAIYALARAALILAFALTVWNLCKPPTAPGAKSSGFALGLMVLCVAGDCVLFQSELYTHCYTPLDPKVSRFEFPAAKLRWPIVRKEHLPNPALAQCHSWTNTPDTRLLCDVSCVEQSRANLLLKYQAWTNTPGAWCQGCLSCAFQWDPPTQAYRADWLAKNVAQMHTVLARTSTQELAVVAGFGGLKFRLLPDAYATRVKTDQDAVRSLRWGVGWDRQVLLTDPQGGTGTSATAPPASISTLTLGEFSANSFDLSLSNAFPQPAWLIYADACTPGWHATVNGKPAPILKAYGALKAVEVQPGVSRVRFDYHTGLRSVCLNAFATLAGCAVALALLWLLWLMLDPNLNRNLDANPFG